MLVAERHEKIELIVNEKGSIRVSELSQTFNVTEETIRRDLEKLEKEGRLQRSHGGAVSVKKEGQIELPYFEREIKNVKEKTSVAEAAVEKVNIHDRIILDASTSAWYMARRLPDMPITVITNSMKVAMELSTREKINVIMSGGTMLTKSLSFVGPLAINAIDPYHVNKAFISCQGIHHKHGISDSNESQSLVKKKMIDIADEVFLLADYTKFGVQAFSRIAPIEAIDYVITDSKTEQQYLTSFQEMNIQVIYA